VGEYQDLHTKDYAHIVLVIVVVLVVVCGRQGGMVHLLVANDPYCTGLAVSLDVRLYLQQIHEQRHEQPTYHHLEQAQEVVQVAGQQQVDPNSYHLLLLFCSVRGVHGRLRVRLALLPSQHFGDGRDQDQDSHLVVL